MDIFSPKIGAEPLKDFPKIIISPTLELKKMREEKREIEIDVKRTIMAIDRHISLIDFTFSNITP